MATKTKYSPEQKKAYAQAKKQEQFELLERAVDALMTSEGWQKYLDSRARFHKYSFNNTILIALQRPDATQVAGRKKWEKEFKRTVKTDEKSIKILAPQIVYEKDEKGNLVYENGEKQVRFVWFKTVEVFDVDQTEGEPLPEPELIQLTGDSHEEYLYRLEQYAKGMGYTVSYEDIEKRGYMDPIAKKIVIKKSEPINAQVRTLCHEVAHGLGVDYSDYTRAQAEVIVESATYLVCRTIGLDTSGMAVPYIASWQSEDQKQKMKLMKEFTAKIDEVSDLILEGVRA
jgi:antirestriction protein ArdC